MLDQEKWQTAASGASPALLININDPFCEWLGKGNQPQNISQSDALAKEPELSQWSEIENFIWKIFKKTKKTAFF